MGPHRAAGLFLALVSAAPLGAGAQGEVFGTPAPFWAQERRGQVTSRAAAERALAFRPFAPEGAWAQAVLLPPFHGSARDRDLVGIGYTYVRQGRTWVLSEWPRNGGDLTVFAPLAPEPGCADVHAAGGREKPRGVVWSTPRGLVFSLTSDGSANARTIRAELRRLVQRGACR
jgi:hypothetical protein